MSFTPGASSISDVVSEPLDFAPAQIVFRNDGDFRADVTLGSVMGSSWVTLGTPGNFSVAPASEETITLGCTPADLGVQVGSLTANLQFAPDSPTAAFSVRCAGKVSAEREVVARTGNRNGGSIAPQSDAAGRYLVFESEASDLMQSSPSKGGPLPDTNGGSDLYRIDTQTGDAIRVSLDDGGGQLAGESFEASVSADGQLVAFVAPSAAPVAVCGESAKMRAQRRKSSGFSVFLRNLGQFPPSTCLVGPALPGGFGTAPRIAPDGRSIVYTAPVTSPGMGQVGQPNVLRSQLTGTARVPQPPTCVSCKVVTVSGPDLSENANGASGFPVVSANGEWVGFESVATNTTQGQAAPCGGGTASVFLRNMLTGVLVRVSPPANQNPAACGLAGSRRPSIDYSGRQIGFESDQPLVPGAIGIQNNVYTTQLGSGQFQRPSQRLNGDSANAGSSGVVVSGDGRSLAFVSAATDIDPDFVPPNGYVPVRSLYSRRLDDVVVGTGRLSRTPLNEEASVESLRPALNYNGTRIAFDSAETHFTVTPQAESFADIFQRLLPANAQVVFWSSFE